MKHQDSKIKGSLKKSNVFSQPQDKIKPPQNFKFVGLKIKHIRLLTLMDCVRSSALHPNSVTKSLIWGYTSVIEFLILVMLLILIFNFFIMSCYLYYYTLRYFSFWHVYIPQELQFFI